MSKEKDNCPLCDEKLIYYNQLGSYYNFLYCPKRIYIKDTDTTHPHYQIQLSSKDNSRYQVRYIIDDFIIRSYWSEGFSKISFVSKLKHRGGSFELNYLFDINKENIKSVIEKLTTIEVFT
jgi:hypothetical protein